MVNGLQLSIILLLLNILLPINFYNVLRIVGSFVIPTLPDWGDNTKRWNLNFFSTESEDFAFTQNINSAQFVRLGFAQSYLITFKYGFILLIVVYLLKFISGKIL